VAVAPYAPKDERPALSREMLNAARAIEDSIHLSGGIAEVAPHLSEPLLRDAIEFAQEIKDANTSAKTLGALLPRLAELGHAQEAFDLALTTVDADRWYYREEPRVSRILSALIPHLPKPLQNQACREALAAAHRIGDADERMLALAAHVSYLPDALLCALLRTVRSINGFAQARVLELLLPGLPEHLLSDALDVANAVPAAERSFGHTVSSPRADALMALAPRLPEPLRSGALKDAGEAVAGIDDSLTRAKATGRLARLSPEPPLLPDEVLGKAISSVQAIGPGHGRPAAISMMAPYLPPALIEKLAQATRAEDERRNQRVRTAIEYTATSEPSTAALRIAFNEAQGIEGTEVRATTLALLAPHLPILLQRREPEREDTLDWEMNQADVLEALAPYLHRDQLPEALNAALGLPDEIPWRVRTLTALAPRLAQLPRADLYPVWQATLRRISLAQRSHLLPLLSALLPLIIRLGGSRAATRTAQAVEVSGRWWP
jgi:hypothetical protein